MPDIIVPTPEQVAEFTIPTAPDNSLEQLLCRLFPNAKEKLGGGMNLKDVVERAIIHCFTEELEGEDVDKLRYQYRHFLVWGEFDLKRKINWACYEIEGSEVYLVPVDQDIPMRESDIARLATSESLVTEKDAFKGGERVIMAGMWGWVWGTVQIADYGPFIQNGETLYPMKFSSQRPEGMPPCWVILGHINTKGLKKLTLSRG